MTLSVTANDHSPTEAPLEDLPSPKQPSTFLPIGQWFLDEAERMKRIEENLLYLEQCPNPQEKISELKDIGFALEILEASYLDDFKVQELKVRLSNLYFLNSLHRS